MVTFIIHLAIGKKFDSVEIEDIKESYLKSSALYNRLHDLISEGKICEAEEKLFKIIKKMLL